MPQAIPFIALAASLAGAGVGIASSLEQSSELKKQSRELQRQGQIEADLERRRGRALAGSQRAAFAKSGVEVTGTSLDVLGQTFQDAELNALRSQFGFQNRAAGLRRQASAAQGRAIGQGISAVGQSATILGDRK